MPGSRWMDWIDPVNSCGPMMTGPVNSRAVLRFPVFSPLSNVIDSHAPRFNRLIEYFRGLVRLLPSGQSESPGSCFSILGVGFVGNLDGLFFERAGGLGVALKFRFVVMESDEVGGFGSFAVGFDAEQGLPFLFYRGEDVGAKFDLGIRGKVGHGVVGEVFSVEWVAGIPGDGLLGGACLEFQLAEILERDRRGGPFGMSLQEDQGEFVALVGKGGGPRPGEEAKDFDFKIPLGRGRGDGDFTTIEFVAGQGIVACSGVNGVFTFGDFPLFVDLTFLGFPLDELDFPDLIFDDEPGEFLDDSGNGIEVARERFFDEVVAVFVGHFEEPRLLGGESCNGCRETEEEFGNDRFHDL